MFAIWMHFKGGILNSRKYVSKDLVYAPKACQVEPQTLIMEKIIMEKIIMEQIIMEKPVNLPWPPDFTGKINYGNNGHLQELWKKKKVRITSGIFWTLMGKNPIMEKSDAGAACLSWTFFFHNSVGDHNHNLLACVSPMFPYLSHQVCSPTSIYQVSGLDVHF